MTSLHVPVVICFIKKYKFSLEQNVHVHNYNTRKKTDLCVLPCNMNLFQKSVINMGIQLYNKVPVTAIHLIKYKYFKRK